MAIAGLAASAGAEVLVEGVHWQVGRAEEGRVTAWRDLKVLFAGSRKLDRRLRARLVLKNDGPLAEEGLLIRYSMTARLVPMNSAGSDGTWAIPFSVDEKRVPKIARGAMIDVPLEANAELSDYLARLARLGFWPDRVKMEAMLDPHPGDASIQVVDDVLEVHFHEAENATAARSGVRR